MWKTNKKPPKATTQQTADQPLKQTNYAQSNKNSLWKSRVVLHQYKYIRLAFIYSLIFWGRQMQDANSVLPLPSNPLARWYNSVYCPMMHLFIPEPSYNVQWCTNISPHPLPFKTGNRHRPAKGRITSATDLQRTNLLFLYYVHVICLDNHWN